MTSCGGTRASTGFGIVNLLTRGLRRTVWRRSPFFFFSLPVRLPVHMLVGLVLPQGGLRSVGFSPQRADDEDDEDDGGGDRPDIIYYVYKINQYMLSPLPKYSTSQNSRRCRDSWPSQRTRASS